MSGIGGGLLTGSWEKGRIVDLSTPDGTVLPEKTRHQVEPIPGLASDWSCIVTEHGKQLQTVGSHWPKSRPLDADMRKTMEKTGVCMGCHQNMSNEELWKKVDTPPKMDVKQHIKKMNTLIHDAAGGSKSDKK